MTEHELSERDVFRDWDAAYLLGSLSAEDRRRYERHLAECGPCAAAVAELAGIPGLLSKVSPAEAEASLGGLPPISPELLPRLVADVERRRRRGRRWVTGLGIAAVAAALAAGPVVLPALVAPLTDPAPQSVSLQLAATPDSASPLSASIRLVQEQWGTRIDMECRYRAGDGYGSESSADYAMYLRDAAGDEVKLASWTASPGHTVTPSGTTSLAITDIRSVEVRAVPGGEVLLRGEL